MPEVNSVRFPSLMCCFFPYLFCYVCDFWAVSKSLCNSYFCRLLTTTERWTLFCKSKSVHPNSVPLYQSKAQIFISNSTSHNCDIKVFIWFTGYQNKIGECSETDVTFRNRMGRAGKSPISHRSKQSGRMRDAVTSYTEAVQSFQTRSWFA